MKISLPFSKESAGEPGVKSSIDELLTAFAATCEEAARGNLEARLVGYSDHPVVGRLGLSINHLLDVCDAYVREAAAAMDHCSRGCYHRPILKQGLLGSYGDSASTINRAALKMKRDADELAAFQKERQAIVDEVTRTTESVAAACEQLSSTTTEISRQVDQSAHATERAVGEADLARSAVHQLAGTAREIESVVTLINKIASQTRLLALNATIEAARAGQQGRGFAVVATEVKQLSQNTAAATENIVRQITAMNEAATKVQSLIDGMSGSVRRTNENATAIAGAVGEQVQATAEIARRVESVSTTMRRISHPDESSQGAIASANISVLPMAA